MGPTIPTSLPIISTVLDPITFFSTILFDLFRSTHVRLSIRLLISFNIRQSLHPSVRPDRPFTIQSIRVPTFRRSVCLSMSLKVIKRLSVDAPFYLWGALLKLNISYSFIKNNLGHVLANFGFFEQSLKQRMKISKKFSLSISLLFI